MEDNKKFVEELILANLNGFKLEETNIGNILFKMGTGKEWYNAQCIVPLSQLNGNSIFRNIYNAKHNTRFESNIDALAHFSKNFTKLNNKEKESIDKRMAYESISIETILGEDLYNKFVETYNKVKQGTIVNEDGSQME